MFSKAFIYVFNHLVAEGPWRLMMATKAAVNRRGGGGGGGAEAANEQAAEISKTLKEGERILAPTRRPDGTLRKAVRIRPGYVPQDEVAVYKSKGSQLKKEIESLEIVPPGYDPEVDVVNKPKTKSAKRNERKKEKRLQVTFIQITQINQSWPSEGSNSNGASTPKAMFGKLAEKPAVGR